jgi:serine/threonine protein kinase
MNILVSKEGCACLAYVGFTRAAGDVNSTIVTSTTTFANTRRWCAPELLDPERFGLRGGNPTKRSDIYSMGMTVYEVSFFRQGSCRRLTYSQVLTGRFPFYECDDVVAALRVIQGVRPKKPIFAATRGYTQEVWDMTISCWDEDPLKRPTLDYVLDALRIAAEKWKLRH